MAEKDFVKGKAEKKVFDNGGEIIKIWIPKDELQRIVKDGGINIEVKVGRESGKMYMENNTYVPNNENAQPTPAPVQPVLPVVQQGQEDINIEDIPF